jgi:hypothetical protein
MNRIPWKSDSVFSWRRLTLVPPPSTARASSIWTSILRLGPLAITLEGFQRKGEAFALGLFRQAALQASNASMSLRVASSPTDPLFSAPQ